MAKFYIQTDKGLIKVGDDITLENIEAALGYVPSDFSGDFYDLTNNPFSNGADGEFNIVDENQNIIAIIDKDGIHSVEMTAKYSNRVHKLTEKADQSDVEAKLDKSTFEEVITLDETGDFVIKDESGNIGLKLNKEGLSVNDVTAGNHKLTAKADQSDVEAKLDKSTFEEVITVDEIGEFVIKDTEGNVGLKLNPDGLHVKDVTAGNHKLTGKAEQSDLTNLRTEINNTIEGLTTDVSGTGSAHGISVGIKQENGKITKVSVNDSNIIFNNLVDNPITIENVENGEEEFVIEDNQGNRGFILNKSGVKAKDFIISESVSLNSVNNSLSNVDIRLENIESLLEEDNDGVINNLKDVIDYFNEVKDTETGAALISKVATHTEKISTNESNITILSTTVASHTSDISTLTSTVVSHTTKINSIQDKVESINEMISDEGDNLIIKDEEEKVGLILDSDGLHVKDVFAYDSGTVAHTLSSKADKSFVEGYVNDAIDTLTSTVTSHTSDIATLSTIVSSHTTKINSISSVVETKLDKSTFEKVINTDDNSIVKVLYDGENIGLSVSASGIYTSGDVTAGNHKLTEKADQSDVDDISGTLETLTSTVTSHTSDISTLTSTVASNKAELNSRINTLTTTVSSNKEELDNTILSLTSTVSSHTTKINSISSDIDEINNTIGGLNTDVSGTGSAGVSVGIKQENGKITKVSVNDSINFYNLVDNPIEDLEKDKFVIKDDSDRYGLKLDSDGLHVQDVFAYVSNSYHVLSNKVDQEAVNSKIEVLTSSLTSTSSGTGNTHSVSVTVSQENGVITNVSVDDSKINFNNLVSNPITVSSDKLEISLDSTVLTTISSDGISTTKKMQAQGGFYQTSDESLKVFYDDIEVNFNTLNSIPKMYYTWKGDSVKQIGTSAQKVQEIYPELVSLNEQTGKLSLDYAKLSIIALKAIDILHEENESLKLELEFIHNEMNKIKSHLGL